jgi:hypothetical protein
MTALNRGDKRDRFANRGDDLYETPAVATATLLRVETLPPVIWEPACGPGALVRVLRAAGHVVYATDLVDYASPDQDEAGWDFLLERQCPIGVQAIVSNPPFKLAGEFIAHALDLCPVVMMFVRLAFYESKRRSAILDGGKLARIHAFANRLPMIHRAGWEGRKVSSGSVPFAWFVFSRDHRGPTTIDRVLWSPEWNLPAEMPV